MKRFRCILVAFICCITVVGCDSSDHKGEAKTPSSSSAVNGSEDKNVEQEDISNKVLTIDNCEELANMLSNKDDIDESYSNFASKYKGRTIEFDGRIDHLMNYENYDTRFDILVGAGDYDPDHQTGPAFKFKNVAAYDLDLDTIDLESEIKVGKNVRIVAKVEEFDSNSGLFFLDPVSVTSR